MTIRNLTIGAVVATLAFAGLTATIASPLPLGTLGDRLHVVTVPTANLSGFLTTSGLSGTAGNIGNSTSAVWALCPADSDGCQIDAVRLALTDTTSGTTGDLSTLGAQSGATGIRARVQTGAGVDVSTIVGALASNAALLAWCPESFAPSFRNHQTDVGCARTFPSGLHLDAGQRFAVDSQSALGSSVTLTVYVDGAVW